jgi:DNA (cytosine-5)-methyltransferase 1
LQTIPDDYEVLGTISAVQKQLGNAVPSALAEVIALRMRRRLLGETGCIETCATLIPCRRGEPPPAEPPQQVAKKYRHLVGKHAPHPGTGKGARASLRTAT